MDQNQTSPTRLVTITGLIISCFLLFVFPAFIVTFFKSILLLTFKLRLLISISFVWLSLALIYIYSYKVEKLNFLIWEEVNYPVNQFLKLVLQTLLICFASSIVIGVVLKMTGFKMDNDKATQLVKFLKSNQLLLFLIPVSAAVTEELIFRGYLQSRLQLLFKNKYIPIIISSLLFGLAHLGYGTAKQIIGTFFIGLVFSIHYNKYRSIKILIICHFLWDYLIFQLFMHMK